MISGGGGPLFLYRFFASSVFHCLVSQGRYPSSSYMEEALSRACISIT